jgi:hypothetical protein
MPRAGAPAFETQVLMRGDVLHRLVKALDDRANDH